MKQNWNLCLDVCYLVFKCKNKYKKFKYFKLNTQSMIVTTFGGGTGSFHLLLALKRLKDVKINAVVSVIDNGGSTGVLRTLYGIIPPGDIRNCLVALSEDTAIWNKLFNYRFDKKLNSHSLGNLILTALTKIYGSFEEGLYAAHKILRIGEHKVMPVTLNDTHLCVEFENGKVLKGEVEIRTYMCKNRSEKIKKFFLESPTQIYPNPEVIAAIRESDFIIFGPGSLYTSILPNFLVPYVSKFINESKAKKIFISNIMTEPGETSGFSVEDCVRVIERYANLDYIVINSSKPSEEILKKYQKENQELMITKTNDDRYFFVDLLNERDILRHDPVKLSRILEWLFIKDVEV